MPALGPRGGAFLAGLLVLAGARMLRAVRGLTRARRRHARLRILGVHPVTVAERLVRETLAAQWGDRLAGLAGGTRERAEAEVRDRLRDLYLIEAEIDPPTAEFQWAGVTQEVPGEVPESWQAPYDEQALDDAGRWAFFFHCLDFSRPLLTPAGPVTLPPPSPIPQRLRHIAYEAP